MPITFKEVSHFYPVDNHNVKVALDDINLQLKGNNMTAIIGTTGSGKSTLVQHLNGLLLPTSGSVEVLDFTLTKDYKGKLKPLRQRVGLVFQFPEYQLFEETIEKDIAFGPKNFGLQPDVIHEKVIEALKDVKLDLSYLQTNPLDLSGGQKRRVAIAGVLAMQPDILVLDEPTAGLDPNGCKEMMSLFKDYQKKNNASVFIVTHDMDNVLNYCDEVVVLHDSKLQYYGDILGFFNNNELMEKAQVLPPLVIQMRNMLIDKGFNIDTNKVNDINALAKAISLEVK